MENVLKKASGQSGHHDQFIQEEVRLVHTVELLSPRAFLQRLMPSIGDTVEGISALSRRSGPDYGFQTFWTAIHTKTCISHSYLHTF